MKLGIKVGPQRQSMYDLEQTNAPFAEVWFQLDQKVSYQEIFSYLDNKRIDVGLHFWGKTRDGYLPSVAHPTIRDESCDLIRQTIDIASQHSFLYVNIHSGVRSLMKPDFQKKVFTIPKHVDSSKENLLETIKTIQYLSHYAKTKQVMLTVETVPPRVIHPWDGDRTTQTYSMNEIPFEIFQTLADSGIAIANDFGHTSANILSTDAKDVWSFLKKQTGMLASATKLLHCTYIVHPYNGTDFHEQLDNPVFETSAAVPNKNQMIELFREFQHRTDVWLIAEPNGQHGKNYVLLQNLLKDAGLA